MSSPIAPSHPDSIERGRCLLITNQITLPHPRFGYEVGPLVQALGVPFPENWRHFPGWELREIKLQAMPRWYLAERVTYIGPSLPEVGSEHLTPRIIQAAADGIEEAKEPRKKGAPLILNDEERFMAFDFVGTLPIDTVDVTGRRKT